LTASRTIVLTIFDEEGRAARTGLVLAAPQRPIAGLLAIEVAMGLH
jgi:hypothetical protein